MERDEEKIVNGDEGSYKLNAAYIYFLSPNGSG